MINELKALREKAWIPTPLGDKFSLHFDDTKYLQLVAEYIIQEVAAHSCESIYEVPDLYADGYADGYNSAVKQIVENLRARLN